MFTCVWLTYVWHDVFARATRRLHTCNRDVFTSGSRASPSCDSHMYSQIFTYVWLPWIWHDTFARATQRIHSRDGDIFTSDSWASPSCDAHMNFHTFECVWHGSHMCGTTPSCVQHDTFNVCDTTHFFATVTYAHARLEYHVRGPNMNSRSHVWRTPPQKLFGSRFSTLFPVFCLICTIFRTERTKGFSRNSWLFLYVDVKRDRVEAAGSKSADNFESFRAVCVSQICIHICATHMFDAHMCSHMWDCSIHTFSHTPLMEEIELEISGSLDVTVRKLAWNSGDSRENLFEIWAVDIIWGLISSVRGM